MEARLARAALLAAVVAALFSPVGQSAAEGASYRTTNFVITAPTPQLAQEIGDLAEVYRKNLALEWLGRELPQWHQPCPITATVSPRLGAGGATSFYFRNRIPYGWRMNIQGSRERVLDSVLPHEVMHTIFATHFGRPLPRWADEGACTTVEHESEKQKQKVNLVRFLQTRRGIAFNKMFATMEYPPDVLPLYAQGYSVARYLIDQKGKRHFVNYVGEGMDTGDWNGTTLKYYGYHNLSDLQVKWLAWVADGSPAVAPSTIPQPSQTLVAAETRPIQSNAQQARVLPQPQRGEFEVRGQSPVAQQADQPAADLAAASNIAQQTYQDITPIQAENTSNGWIARDQGRRPRSKVRQATPQQNVTRPQSAQTAQQTILQWQRTGGQAAAATAYQPAPPATIGATDTGRSYYDRISGAPETIRRRLDAGVVIPLRPLDEYDD